MVATYDYRAEDGVLLFQALRYEPKGFSQGYYDEEGEWIPNIRGIRRVLYHLPQFLQVDAAGWVFVVEGEKDVHSLEALGLVATTNPMGAGYWLREYSDSLAGRNAILLPDNDEKGRRHIQQVAQSLQSKASTIKIVELPGLPEKADITDWLGLAHTKEELLALVATTPTWERPKEEPAPMLAPQIHLTDLGNAERLIARHGKDLRYVPQWKTWVSWDGRRWARDLVEEIRRRAKDTILHMYAEAHHEEDDKALKWAFRSESRERLEGMIALARSASEVVATPAQFDVNPWAFNVSNGTLDLRTGELREHRREDLITKLAPVEYDANARLDLWEGMLGTATDADSELAEFLQRVAGYALTGSTAEEKPFFVHGPRGVQ